MNKLLTLILAAMGLPSQAQTAIPEAEKLWIEAWECEQMLTACEGTAEAWSTQLEMVQRAMQGGTAGALLVLAQAEASGRVAGQSGFGRFAEVQSKSQPLAERGDRYAQYALATYYFITGNDVQALRWYNESARQGFYLAELALATNYEHGMGVAADDETALKWYLKAAEHGSDVAQYNVAMFYESGRGSLQADHQKAMEWLEKATHNDHPAALLTLSEWHHHDGNAAKAFELSMRAATTGLPTFKQAAAMMNVAQYYEQGRGTERSVVQARRWYIKAARSGVEKVLGGARDGLRRLP